MYVVESYFVYLVVSIVTTFLVARTLHKNGRVFLVDAFRGNEAMADSINHLLVVGFYLINVGFVTFVLRTQEHVETVRKAMEIVSEKTGFALLVLGMMHFMNLYIFSRVRRSLRERFDAPL